MANENVSKNKRLLPPVYFIVAIALMLLLHFFVPVTSWLPRPWRAAGLLLISIGLSLNVVADRQFKSHNTTVKPFQPSSALVTDGIFHFTRNPMYLGMVVVLVGIGIILATVSPIIVILIFAWWINTRFIVLEEQSLTEQFGQAYIEYRSKVRRWL